jgi:hypothetical protein
MPERNPTPVRASDRREKTELGSREKKGRGESRPLFFGDAAGWLGPDYTAEL